MPAPVVMVHGAFCGGWVFDDFRVPFEAAGHQVLCPDLRGHGADEPPQSVAGVSMSDFAQDIMAFCAGLDEPPILLGHSMGGLVAQLAARRTPLAALVLLAPSAPWGVTGSTVEEAVTAMGLQALGPFWFHAIPPDVGLMVNYSLDRMPKGERRPVLERLRPESGRAVWETLNWWMDPMMTTSVGLRTPSAPALALVGERDVVHPPATVKQTAQRIGAEFLVLPGMSHWLPGEPGWQEVAEIVLGWLEGLEASAPASSRR
ncbi:alpha/beta fold hydrolase [Phenylobacterium sp.]|uniref:alpha/beta fold hydrolase n=1 Tax=Phenylobacterium sp. TaxID=1871053 RepID=UPI0035B42B2F